MISKMVSHFKIPKNITELTQFRQELLKKAVNGGENDRLI